MHLKQLKLAGFKSFVDPTVVYFPSQLVAVVGPNGCGKSNVIDAVRWVMGESTARNLRGESMTDVIFNGSSHRKSVGQASVELVFDNNGGRLVGPFASYGEIAVKRVVTRHGDSFYYLNGARCRRKDITDIFLGTGAGARSYSIIGQGTISQLIEAKPEELRIHFEEAAGISKYKERRRETLQRIDHTYENLARVTDIRDELEKQLQRLERQAKAAERYLTLKEEEQLCRAEMLALKWQDLISQQAAKQHQLRDLAMHYEQQQCILTKANTERILLNEKIHDVDEQTQQIQVDFYQLGTQIARLEETIQQQTRERKRLEHDQQQMQADWQVIAEQVQQDRDDLIVFKQIDRDLEEKVGQLSIQFREQDTDWRDTQTQQAQWERRWQDVQAHTNNLNREFQVAQVHAQHLAENYQQTVLRLDRLKLEQEAISLSDLQQVQKTLEEQRIKLIEEHALDEHQFKASQEHTEQFRVQLQRIEQQLHEVQDDFHRVKTEHAALMAAQRAARQSVKKNKENIQAWSEKPRLMDVLQIESKWQAACERVLNETLHAYVLETFSELWPQRVNCERQGESIVILRDVSPKPGYHPRLVDKIQGTIPAHVYPLEHIYAAEHFDEALSWLPGLEQHQSIITPEGFWLGQGWVKFVNPEEQDDLGLLARQQKITDLSLLIQELQQKIDLLRTDRDHTYQQLQKSLDDVELQKINVNTSSEALRANRSALSSHEQTAAHAEKQAIILGSQCEELQFLLEETATEQCTLKETLHVLEEQCFEHEQRQAQWLCQKQEWLDTLALKNKQIEASRLQLHHAELEYDRGKNKIQQLEERIQGEKKRLDILQGRLEHAALLCLQTEEPRIGLKDQLTEHVQKHNELDSQLSRGREQLSQLRMALEDCEKNILNCDFEVKRIQDLVTQVRMEEHALAVRANSVQESLDESGLKAQALLEHVPKGITQSLREDELIVVAEKIKRLGMINLAAIEEFATEQQRKVYLDDQYNDLSQALAALESAIEKMDKETRLRLEHTFDAVNTSFKVLFPRLFGGGRAQLELTCDNLLEAGIVVMAQPPGKRNSTIHLLSGGEKAMTAIALVFAIFQLNPSPFCMLDEVDAPLDDVNVGRFCDLVKEMSKVVQFIFITHNKVTMELADHLIGVTMREPGVSRLVAVDVTQALTME